MNGCADDARELDELVGTLGHMYVIPYESTAETYLQSLQFRIIHRYFACKYNLHLWNIGGDECEFCNDADTLSYYFAECDSVVQFWKFLKRWFIRTFQFVINFTSLDIQLGIPNYDNSNDVMILNFVILFAKYYIYNCKKNGMPIDFFVPPFTDICLVLYAWNENTSML